MHSSKQSEAKAPRAEAWEGSAADESRRKPVRAAISPYEIISTRPWIPHPYCNATRRVILHGPDGSTTFDYTRIGLRENGVLQIPDFTLNPTSGVRITTPTMTMAGLRRWCAAPAVRDIRTCTAARNATRLPAILMPTCRAGSRHT